MRVLAAAALFIALASDAAAQAVPAAQIAYVERRGLMAADAQCNLFTQPVRSALEAGAGQASGALLRAGWTRARLSELESAAVNAASARPCDDDRTAAAAAKARAAFDAWTREPQASFAGAHRTWVARRRADAGGWRLSQTGPSGFTFGVREQDGAGELCLVLPLQSARAPASAQLVMRDPRRDDGRFLELPGRRAAGLAAGAPPPRAAQTFFARERRLETTPDGARQVVYVFPDAAFAALLALDPREAVEARTGAAPLLIEVGDINAARAFLAAQS